MKVRITLMRMQVVMGKYRRKFVRLMEISPGSLPSLSSENQSV